MIYKYEPQIFLKFQPWPYFANKPTFPQLKYVMQIDWAMDGPIDNKPGFVLLKTFLDDILNFGSSCEEGEE